MFVQVYLWQNGTGSFYFGCWSDDPDIAADNNFASLIDALTVKADMVPFSLLAYNSDGDGNSITDHNWVVKG